MSYVAGKRLTEALITLKASARCLSRSVGDSGLTSSWQLNGLTWKAEVIVEMSRGLSLTFEATDPDTDRTVNFEIDTDLYDISQPRHRAFAEEIERDIIEFIGNLTEGKIRRAQSPSGLVLVSPLAGAYVRVAKGRFLISSSIHRQENDALGAGNYVPVI